MQPAPASRKAECPLSVSDTLGRRPGKAPWCLCSTEYLNFFGKIDMRQSSLQTINSCTVVRTKNVEILQRKRKKLGEHTAKWPVKLPAA